MLQNAIIFSCFHQTQPKWVAFCFWRDIMKHGGDLMKYTAFMVDIVNSKKLTRENRKDVQFYIKKTLNVLNEVFKPSLTFDVIFSAGDEVQGLFNNPSAAFMYYRLLKMILSPLQIRCGIGIGEWDVKIANGTSAEQDGTAFHNAREAISKAHNVMGWNILVYSNGAQDLTINTLLNASSLLSQKQSVYQNEIALLVELTVPFIDENAMEMESLPSVLKLLQEKETINFYRPSKEKSENDYTHFYASSLENEPVYVFSKDIFDDKMFLESTIKKGISTKIASITNTTRQNIDNIIKSGNISNIRNIDLTAILFMNKNY